MALPFSVSSGVHNGLWQGPVHVPHRPARSPNSQSPPLSSLHCWLSESLGGQQAVAFVFFTSFL